METKKFLIIWLSSVAVLGLILWGLITANSNYVDEANGDIETLRDTYGVDESRGELLISCEDGSYDVFKSQETELSLCGEILTDEIRSYLEQSL